MKTQRGFRSLRAVKALTAGMDVTIDDAMNVRRFMEWMDLKKWLFLVFSLVICENEECLGMLTHDLLRLYWFHQVIHSLFANNHKEATTLK